MRAELCVAIYSIILTPVVRISCRRPMASKVRAELCVAIYSIILTHVVHRQVTRHASEFYFHLLLVK